MISHFYNDGPYRKSQTIVFFLAAAGYIQIIEIGKKVPHFFYFKRFIEYKSYY
jgi:hypothetical protein